MQPALPKRTLAALTTKPCVTWSGENFQYLIPTRQNKNWFVRAGYDAFSMRRAVFPHRHDEAKVSGDCLNTSSDGEKVLFFLYLVWLLHHRLINSRREILGVFITGWAFGAAPPQFSVTSAPPGQCKAFASTFPPVAESVL